MSLHLQHDLSELFALGETLLGGGTVGEGDDLVDDRAEALGKEISLSAVFFSIDVDAELRSWDTDIARASVGKRGSGVHRGGSEQLRSRIEH